MTEAFLIKELDSATRQIKMWWTNVAPRDSYLRVLFNKIQFLKAYLAAIKNLRDDDYVTNKTAEILGKTCYGGRRIL